MGEGRSVAPKGNGTTPAQRRMQLEGQIAHLRGELGELIDEMERRGRRALDLQRQMAQRPQLVTVGLVIVGSAAVTAVTAVVVQSRARPRTRIDAARLRLARAVAPPQARGRRRLPRPRRRRIGLREALLTGAAVAAFLKLRG